MRAILIDDEPLATDRLATGLAVIPGITVVATAMNGTDGLHLIEQLKPDIVFLDIEMPGMNGIELAEQLSRLPDPPETIFITAFDRFATQAFTVEAADYLLKPVSAERLSLAVARAIKRWGLRRAVSRNHELERQLQVTAPIPAVDATPDADGYVSALWVPVKAGRVLLPVASINFIEAARDYVLLHTDLKAHILRAKMTDLERKLDPQQVLRVHRSFMVRIANVAGVERPGRGALRLRMRDGTAIQVGPLYIDDAIRSLGLDRGAVTWDEPVQA